MALRPIDEAGDVLVKVTRLTENMTCPQQIYRVIITLYQDGHLQTCLNNTYGYQKGRWRFRNSGVVCSSEKIVNNVFCIIVLSQQFHQSVTSAEALYWLSVGPFDTLRNYPVKDIGILFVFDDIRIVQLRLYAAITTPILRVKDGCKIY